MAPMLSHAVEAGGRVVPFAAFALAENTAAFLPVLHQAILRRGVPKRLYVDNGAAYRSHHLALVCAKLGITLIHARPYQPQGKGKQERWFRTLRMQLQPTLSAADLGSLEALNRRLWAWIEGEYHHRPHQGLDGITPLDRWGTYLLNPGRKCRRGDIVRSKARYGNEIRKKAHGKRGSFSRSDGGCTAAHARQPPRTASSQARSHPHATAS